MHSLGLGHGPMTAEHSMFAGTTQMAGMGAPPAHPAPQAAPSVMTGVEAVATSGAAFDKLWLQMTTHHQGAVTMARTELTDGANTEAKQLAQSIIDSQGKEITTITTLLANLGS